MVVQYWLSAEQDWLLHQFLTDKPGWRNRQTQRTLNPQAARPWGFKSPSGHQLINYLYDFDRLLTEPPIGLVPLLVPLFSVLLPSACESSQCRDEPLKKNACL